MAESVWLAGLDNRHDGNSRGGRGTKIYVTYHSEGQFHFMFI